mmetsp:Transcript_3420/g.9815  ORF Transcript_3420/g.9815 Transcript_3420/m.9815 type:complete len:214 (-) Transcript_3420:2280-2921(-)
MPLESFVGLEGSSTQERRRQVPFVEPLSRMCQRLPTYSKTQWIRETLANIGSEIWMVAASPRPIVARRSKRVSRSPVRGPEMKSSSKGGTGTCNGFTEGVDGVCWPPLAGSAISSLSARWRDKPARPMAAAWHRRLDGLNHAAFFTPPSTKGTPSCASVISAPSPQSAPASLWGESPKDGLASSPHPSASAPPPAAIGEAPPPLPAPRPCCSR